MKHFDSTNFDETLFNYFEGNLSLGDQQQLFDLMEKDPSLKIEFEAWGSTYSLSNEPAAPAYPNMDKLMVKEKVGYQGWFMWGTTALLLLLGLYGISSYLFTDYTAIEGNNERLARYDGHIDNEKLKERVAEEKTISLSEEVANQESVSTKSEENNKPQLNTSNTTKAKKLNAANNKNSEGLKDNASIRNNNVGVSSENVNENLGVSEKNISTKEQEIAVTDIKTKIVNSTSSTKTNNNSNPNINKGGSSSGADSNQINKLESKKGEVQEGGKTYGDRNREGISAIGTTVLNETSTTKEKEAKHDEEKEKSQEPAKMPKEGDAKIADNKSPRFEPSTYSSVKDPSFIRSSSSPMVLNPAFVGTMQCSRLSLNYRYQLNENGQQYSTMYAAYDKYVKGLNGGVGVVAYYDNLLNGAVETMYAGGVFSPKFEIETGSGNKISVEPAIQLGYTTMTYNWKAIEEAGYSDPRHGFEYGQSNTEDVTNSGFMDMAAGIVLKSKKLFGGLAVDHITQSKKDVITSAYIPRRFTGQLGYNIQKRNDSPFSVTPGIQFTKQANLFQLMWSSTFRYKNFIGGVGFANQDWLILMAGYQAGQFRIGYSYDASVSTIGNSYSTSHEVSLRYLFGCQEKPTTSSYLLSKAY